MSHQYRKLIPMLVLHFIIMFAVMYTMVDGFSDVFLNLNQFYMTIMMVAPMAALMPALMPSMYPDRKKNLLIGAVSVAVFAAFFVFMRDQTFVGDRQFLKSMIPHHSGAILMCEQARLTDREILDLCERIKRSQREEIDQMKAILDRGR